MKVRQPFQLRDYSDPRRRARTVLVRALAPVLARAGFDLEVRHFYSPIPSPDTINYGIWEASSDLLGVELDAKAQMLFVERELAEHIREFGPPRKPTRRINEFFLDNGYYQAIDAHILYAMVRRFKPARVLELGAGFSTLVTAAAARANATEGQPVLFETFDPYARQHEDGKVEGLTALRPLRAEALAHEEFGKLRSGDILFVDTSHTVKIGGDVTHIVLEVLPRLAPGVIVHFHDIFLPFHYPRHWVEHNRWYWAEQYLVQAFLSFNRDFEVMIACHALWREFPGRLENLMPEARGAPPPLALWLRRVEHGHARAQST